MTTIFYETKKCAVCGKQSEHIVIGSTNTFGLPDLDMRPSEMQRSTIDTWIQRCPSCGYCSPDISERIEKASEIIQRDYYQRQLNDQEFPKLANDFLCYSLIQENAGDYRKAGWSCIHAAWVCDDEGFKSAQKCRMRAVILLQKAKENGQKFGKRVGEEEAIIVDLLRRSGQFDLALRICDDGLKKKPKKLISDILHFQKILINKSDVSCYNIEDATNENK